MHISHDPLIVVLSVIVAIQGAYVGLGLALQSRAAAGYQASYATCRLVDHARCCDLVDAFHRHAGGAPFLPGRLSRLPHLTLILGKRAGDGHRRLCRDGGTADGRRLAASALFMGLGIASMHSTSV